MKKLLIIGLVLASLVVSEYAAAQPNLWPFNRDPRAAQQRQQRRQNKKIEKYQGDQVRKQPGSKRYLTVGVSANSMNYFGDITPNSGRLSTDFSFTRPGFGVEASYKFHALFNATVGFNYGRISGSDFSASNPNDPLAAFNYGRNLHFRNDIKELSALFTYDIVPNFGDGNARPRLTPYAFVGVSVFHHNPKALVPDTDPFSGTALAEAGTWVSLQPLGTEGQNLTNYATTTPSPYSLFQVAVPFGIGVRYRLTPFLDLAYEIGYRKTFTDYLDDVSGTYIDAGAFSDPLARALADRSLEETHVLDGQTRDLSFLLSLYQEPYQTFTSDFDGNTYTILAGRARFTDPGNIRGNAQFDDIYVMNRIKVIMVLGAVSTKNRKFR